MPTIIYTEGCEAKSIQKKRRVAMGHDNNESSEKRTMSKISSDLSNGNYANDDGISPKKEYIGQDPKIGSTTIGSASSSLYHCPLKEIGNMKTSTVNAPLSQAERIKQICRVTSTLHSKRKSSLKVLQISKKTNSAKQVHPVSIRHSQEKSSACRDKVAEGPPRIPFPQMAKKKKGKPISSHSLWRFDGDTAASKTNTNSKLNPSQAQTCQSHAWDFTNFTFQHDKLLARGNFGSVYLSTHRSSGKKYCVKMIDKRSASDTEAIHFIQREIAIHSRLSHPNIVAFLGFHHDYDNVYIALEHCLGDLFQVKLQSFPNRVKDEALLDDDIVGTSTSTKLRDRTPPMTLKEAAWYVHQVLRALSYLHYHNVYHRDIKPENILMYNGDHFADVKLCDFGYSIHADNSHISNGTWRNTFCGTTEYVPLEMVDYVPLSYHYDANEVVKRMKAEGKVACMNEKLIHYDTRYIDSWMVGILAYELVVGKTPFFMEESEQANWKIKNGYCRRREAVFDLIRGVEEHVDFDLENAYFKKNNENSSILLFRDFVQKMTKKRGEDRMLPKDALHHDWIGSFCY